MGLPAGAMNVSGWLAEDIIKKYQGTLLAAILKAELPISYPANTSEYDIKEYSYVHCFDNIDLNNKALINTGILSTLMKNYIAHYENKAYSFSEQVENYAIAVDSLIIKTQGHTIINDLYIKELSYKFKYGDYDVICAYIEEYYNKHDACNTNSRTATAKERLAGMKHASVGKQAHEINMPTYDGKILKLSEINSDYMLIIFWSTNCYHCTQVIPKVKKQIYDHRNDNRLEILAISADTDEKQWKDFVKNENLNWINYCDLKGWESEITKNYNVQGTPTFILLNKDKTIISKPVTLETLESKLKELKIIL